MNITLPFPPSVNRYWRNLHGRTLISKGGREYRALVVALLAGQKLPTWGSRLLTVSITAWLPDNRRRDADNLFKAPLDALAHAGVYTDDNQIMKLAIHKMGVDRRNPRLEICISELDVPRETCNALGVT